MFFCVHLAKKIYAVTCGHGLSIDDRLFWEPQVELGDVRALCMTKYMATGTIDAALVEVKHSQPCSNYGETSTGRLRVSTSNPAWRGPLNGLAVQKFCNGGDEVTGTVTDDDYSNFDSGFFRCFAVQNGDQPIHVDGESGMLVTAEPKDTEDEAHGGQRAEVVQPVGMLVGIETKIPAEGRPRTVSIGIPYMRNMDALIAACGEELFVDNDR